MNIARKYKISKLLNTPLDDKEQLIINTIRKQLFLCVVYVDDKEEKIVYCFNDDMVYEAKAYFNELADIYYMRHYSFNICLENFNILQRNSNNKFLAELILMLFKEIRNEYLDYKVIDDLPYPTAEILEKNITQLIDSIRLYISIIGNK